MGVDKTRNRYVKNSPYHFCYIKEKWKSNFSLLIYIILWMNFMNSSLYFSFRNHALNFLIDYLNCLPNMLKYEANARKKNCYHVSTWWEYVVLVPSSIPNLPIMKWRLRTTINKCIIHMSIKWSTSERNYMSLKMAL